MTQRGLHVLAISGSLRRRSYNSALLRAAAGLMPAGATIELFDGLRSVPPYDQDLEDMGSPPAAVSRLREAMARADAVLFATPEYNSSIPGQLKNALDWASRPVDAGVLRGKPVAVIGGSTGMFGAVWAKAELRKVLASIGARVVDADLSVPAIHDAVCPDGALASRQQRNRLAEVLTALVDEARYRSERLAA